MREICSKLTTNTPDNVNLTFFWCFYCLLSTGKCLLGYYTFSLSKKRYHCAVKENYSIAFRWKQVCRKLVEINLLKMTNQSLKGCFRSSTVFQFFCYSCKGEWKYSGRERLAVVGGFFRGFTWNILLKWSFIWLICVHLCRIHPSL